MIIFTSIFTTFELSSIFGGSWAVLKIGSSLKPTTMGKFSLPKSVKRSVDEIVCVFVWGGG